MKNMNPHLVEQILVPHKAFSDAHDRLETYFQCTRGATEPLCLAILGESRTGKSRVIESFCTHHPRVETKEGIDIPVLRVRTPTVPTVKGMALQMLRAMGERHDLGGDATKLTEQLIRLLKSCKTRAIVIEEFNHFVESRSGKVAFHAADWLKELSDAKEMMICISGLEYCKKAVTLNEQLVGRFSNSIVMPRFEWFDDEKREEFICILEAFECTLSKYYDMPAISKESMAFRMFCATGGIIGYISKLLREVVMKAVSEQRSVITLGHLADADRKASWHVEQSLGSFEPDFPDHPTEVMVSRAEQLGKRVVEKPKKRGRPPAEKIDVNGRLVTTAR